MDVRTFEQEKCPLHSLHAGFRRTDGDFRHIGQAGRYGRSMGGDAHPRTPRAKARQTCKGVVTFNVHSSSGNLKKWVIKTTQCQINHVRKGIPFSYLYQHLPYFAGDRIVSPFPEGGRGASQKRPLLPGGQPGSSGLFPRATSSTGAFILSGGRCCAVACVLVAEGASYAVLRSGRRSRAAQGRWAKISLRLFPRWGARPRKAGTRFCLSQTLDDALH